MAWVATPLIDYRDNLRQGPLALKLWLSDAPNIIGDDGGGGG
jgi:hypothetical protein